MTEAMSVWDLRPADIDPGNLLTQLSLLLPADGRPIHRSGSYVDTEGAPNCIIAHWASNLGVDLTDLHEIDPVTGHQYNFAFIGRMASEASTTLGKFVSEMPSESRKILGLVQAGQDVGGTWQDGVDYAVDYFIGDRQPVGSVADVEAGDYL